MTENEKKNPAIRLFYGWWIVLAGFVIIAYGTGGHSYIISQLADLVKNEFGASQSQFGVAFFISTAASFLALLISAPLIDKYGPRKVMLIGVPIAGIGFLGLSFANTLVIFYIQWILIEVGISAGFLLAVQTATANWFMRRRCIALAIISVAPILGKLIMTSFGEWMEPEQMWRSTFLVFGVVMLVIMIPLVFVIRHRPEQHGDLPDGKQAKTNVTFEPVIEQNNQITEVNFSLQQALKTRAFWMLSIALAMANGAGILTHFHRVTHLVNQGFAIDTARDIFNVAPGWGLAVILIFGYLGDKFPKRYLLTIAVAIQSASVFILMTAGSFTQVYIYNVLNCFGSGMIPLILAIRADYFGRKNFATITVAMMFIRLIVGVPFGSLSGIIGGTFWLSISTGFVAALLFFFARPPEHSLNVQF